MSTDWHPSMGPSDLLLTQCDICEKFVQNLAEHYDRLHPADEETARRAIKRARESARSAARRSRRGQMRLDLP